MLNKKSKLATSLSIDVNEAKTIRNLFDCNTLINAAHNANRIDLHDYYRLMKELNDKRQSLDEKK